MKFTDPCGIADAMLISEARAKTAAGITLSRYPTRVSSDSYYDGKTPGAAGVAVEV